MARLLHELRKPTTGGSTNHKEFLLKYDQILIDGNNLCRRMQYAHADLKVGTVPTFTGVQFGVLKQILSLHETRPDSTILFCWDDGARYRKAIYKEYKQHRKPMPDEAREIYNKQIKDTKKLLRALNITQVFVPHEEADDAIFTLVKRAEKKRRKTLILSNDLDFLQLVSKRTHLHSSKGGETKKYTPKTHQEEFGFDPQKWTGILAAAGDPSDNIKGVRGIGEKKASALVQHTPDILDRCFAGEPVDLDHSLGEVSKAMRTTLEKITENIEDFRLAYRLVQMKDFKKVTKTEGLYDARLIRRCVIRWQFASLEAQVDRYMNDQQKGTK